MKKKGKWFEGDVFMMPSKQLVISRKFGKDVMKPTALETRVIKGKTHSRYYYKKQKPGEFWD